MAENSFTEVTILLKEAGDRAWAVLGRENALWASINEAEKSVFAFERLDYIETSLENLANYWKDKLNKDDYDFIYQTLIKSKEMTEQQDL